MIITVIPAFNEESRVGSVVRGARKHCDRVIVVDDGSSDGTGSAAKAAGAMVIRHLLNSGAGAATMTGIAAARVFGATTIITLDADGQHDPAEIPLLLQPIQENMADIVFANRFGLIDPVQGKRRNHIPLIRRLANATGNLLTLLASGHWISDSQSGFKVFGPRAVEQVDIRMNGFEFCTEIVREAALRHWHIAEVPTKVLYSEYTLAKGQSFAMGIKTALKILLRSFLR